MLHYQNLYCRTPIFHVKTWDVESEFPSLLNYHIFFVFFLGGEGLGNVSTTLGESLTNLQFPLTSWGEL